MIKLSQAGENQLSSKSVQPTYRLHINNTLIPKAKIINYSYSASMEYGSMSLTCEILNNDGLYSPDNPSNPFKFGTKVELWEGLQTASNEEFKKFTGVIRQVDARKQSGKNTVTVTALDYIAKLQDLDLDVTFEATRVSAPNVTLSPATTGNAFIFNSPNPYWADNPPPAIRMIETIDMTEDRLFSGFEIQKVSGQVLFTNSVNTVEVQIHADYYYYSTFLYIEDIIRDIVKLSDGYSNAVFTDTDMTHTFQACEGAVNDTLQPNTAVDVTDDITYLSKDISDTDMSITVLDGAKLPNSSGYIKIDDEYVQYSGKSGNVLTVSARQAFSSTAAKHVMGATIRQAWEPRRLWYLSYSNVTTVLTSGNFTITGSGGSFTSFAAQYRRYGCVVLSGALSSNPGDGVVCTSDYTFYTIQATGVNVVTAKFTEKGIKNRFDAIQELRKVLAPNYIIRTKGDGKIWGEYITQKATADYTLKLATSMSYAQDADIYSRVVVYGKNAAPISVNSRAGVDGFRYISNTVGTSLTLEKDTDDTYHTLSTSSALHIYPRILSDPKPKLYMNGVILDATPTLVQQAPIQVSKGYFYYTNFRSKVEWNIVQFETDGEWYDFLQNNVEIRFPATYIDKNRSIIIYNGTSSIVQGTDGYTVPPNSSYDDYMLLTPKDRELKYYQYGIMDYENGVLLISGKHPMRSALLYTANNADFYKSFNESVWEVGRHAIRLAKGKGVSNYDNGAAYFKLNKSVVSRTDAEKSEFTADYTYQVYIANMGWDRIIDLNNNTQLQVEFFQEPVQDLVIAVIDIGEITKIDLIDIVGGFIKPSDNLDISRQYGGANNIYSLKWSNDNLTYNYISKETTGFTLSTGKTISFDSQSLGEGFETRYIRIHLDKAERVNWGKVESSTGKIPDKWFIAISEINMYTDTVLRGECKLTSNANLGATSNKWLHDPNSTILNLTGDIVYKITDINESLDTQEKCDLRAKGLLAEFYKNHTKASIDIVYHPSIMVGDTVNVTDTINQVNRNYFVEGISSNNGRINLTLGFYP